MKTPSSLLLIATLLLASAAAQAASWSMANKAGGRIVLSTEPCDDPNGDGLLQAYTFTESGDYQKGCWTVADSLVHIGWGQGRRSVFTQDRFVAEKPVKPAPPAPPPAPRKPASYL